MVSVPYVYEECRTEDERFGLIVVLEKIRAFRSLGRWREEEFPRRIRLFSSS